MANDTPVEPDPADEQPEATVARAEYDRVAEALARAIERQGEAQAQAAALARDLATAQQRITDLEAELAALTPQEES